MKRSGNGGKEGAGPRKRGPGEAQYAGSGRRHSKCLIVDGYNILARQRRSSLKDIADLDAARGNLLEQLVEYQAYFGEQVFLVFDAHHTSEPTVTSVWRGVQVIYTAPHETADQRIERLVYDLRLQYHSITVASSDFAEQQVIFGGGALRITANELIRRLHQSSAMIRKTLTDHRQERQNPKLGDTIRQDLAKLFEKWRRE